MRKIRISFNGFLIWFAIAGAVGAKIHGDTSSCVSWTLLVIIFILNAIFWDKIFKEIR